MEVARIPCITQAVLKKGNVMMRPYKLLISLSLATLLALEAAATPLSAASAGEDVKATIDSVMKVLNDPKLQGNNQKKERREALRKVILPKFDFTEMAKRALGSNWGREPDKQKEFVTAFTQLLEDSYAAQVESANGNKITVVNERTEKEYAEVDTKIVSPKGEETPMTYKLHSVGSDWKVYDVVIANVSLVNNYRSQFNRVLANGSVDELIKRMKEKKMERRS
jgi:phospholipid transport system substrate-binding protein